MTVPDLTRLAAEAANQSQNPLAMMVNIQQPGGVSQQVPVVVGIFLMLGDISANLNRVASQLEQLAVTNIVK